MISLICTHCQTQLTIDDGFAGGVCRCQHCGTIQTVPARLTDSFSPAAMENTTGRSLYRTQKAKNSETDSTAGGSATLDQLADIVASSGLGAGSGSGLSSLRGRNKAASPGVPLPSANAAPNRTPLLVALGAALAVAIGVCIWLATRAGSSAAPAPNDGQTHATDAPTADVASGPLATTPGADGSSNSAAPTGPQFCGVRLTGSSVVYLLDRGDSTSEVFDSLKQATLASIASLSPERKFQVIFWDNHTGDESYPPTDPTFATPANIAACAKAMDDVMAFHQSDITEPLKKAVSESPEEILIITAKGFQLDDSFATAVEAIVKDSKIKIDTISLRSTDCPALKSIAHASGGSYAMLSDGALKAAAPAQ